MEEDVWAHVFPEGGGCRSRKADARTDHRARCVVEHESWNQGKLTCFDKARKLRLTGREVPSGSATASMSCCSRIRRRGWSGDLARLAQGDRSLDEGQSHPRQRRRAGRLNMPSSARSPTTWAAIQPEVYIFTDMQQSTWQALPALNEPKKDGKGIGKNALEEIQKHARVIFVNIGGDKVDNLALTELRFSDNLVTTGRPVRLTAKVNNYSKDTRRFRLELWEGKAREGGGDSLTLRHVKRFPERELAPPRNRSRMKHRVRVDSWRPICCILSKSPAPMSCRCG